jgi:glutamate/tyrosine decarboxylase-like PLP-dependent enzyme
MVERHLDVAAHLGTLVEEDPDLELLAPVRLCVVCFRYRPRGVARERLDALNARLGAALLADGRVYAGTSTYRGMTVLRPAIVNWSTTEADVELLVEVVRSLGAELVDEPVGR